MCVCVDVLLLLLCCCCFFVFVFGGGCFEVRFVGVQRGFLSERKGKVIPYRGAEDGKGTGGNSRKSGTRGLEDEFQKQNGEYGRVCKVADSHTDKTEQRA